LVLAPAPPAPTVSGISPNSGPAAGGTRVTISGANFTGSTSVNFGGTAASSFSIDSDTQITAFAPAGSGTVDVTVRSANGTSTKSQADQFIYGQQAPTVAPSAPGVKSSSDVAFSGSVNPDGLPTTVYFEYGLDPRYHAAADGPTYTDTTPPQQIGAGDSPVVVTADVSGLAPNALYHVRLVASNGAGTTYGSDQTFTTKQAPPPPPPKLGQTEDASTVSGVVLIKTTHGFVPLTEATALPSGAVIDARLGSMQLTAAAGRGKTQTGTFGGAVFQLTQDHQGLTTLALQEGTFPTAPSYASCKLHKAADAQTASLSSKILQTLHASAHGRFRTRGRFAAATVRGTQWTTSDRCDGTLVSVQLHTVAVTDFVRHITVLVHQGHSYLARATK
jgi:hypothetical protein